MARKLHEQNAVRRYLLRQLTDSEEQEVELRLLGDEAFSQELEIVEDELIDEYLAGELERDERVSFKETFLTNPKRQRKLEAAQAFRRYFKTLPAPAGRLARLWKSINQPFFSSPIGIAFAALALVVVGLAIWRAGFFRSSDVDQGLVALKEAYRQERPVEARISNFDYAPFIATRGNEPERVNALERSRAERLLLDAVKDHPGADSYHALGKFYLLQKDADKAIEYFEQARKADPNDAQIYADLGAAYLEKGKRELDTARDGAGASGGKGLEYLGRSLEYLRQALEHNPNLLEALFNLALVHQYQGLDRQAETDWRAYLEKDPSSQWAVDAQQRLKLLQEKKAAGSQNSGDPLETFMRAYRARDGDAAWDIYKRSHGTAGNSITKGLIDGFLADKSTENLQALNYLGQIENLKAQDAYTSDLAKVYASATPQTQTLLIQAREQVAKGYELFRQAKLAEGTDLLNNARAAFQKAGNLPEALAAETAIARGAAVQPDLEKGQELLARIIPVCEAKRYKWLLAENLAEQAHLDSNLNNYSQAIGNGNRSLQLFQELNDTGSALDIFVQLATLHLFLNDNELSFSYLRRALDLALEQGAPPTRIWGIHIAASLNLTALQLYRAALDYQNEALQLVLPLRIPLYVSRSHQYMGLTYGSLGRFDLAVENVRLAYEQGQPLAGERMGQNMMASASLKLGDLYRASGDETSALAAYEESSRLYQALGFAHYNYAAHKGKFLSYLAQTNDAMASQELSIVLGLFDEYREKILDERQKTFFFDREQDIYDLAIDFTYSRIGDERRAFDYSETCRARNLRELMHHGAQVTQSDSGLDLRSIRPANSPSTSPLTWIEIQQQLPERVQVVQYALLEKKLLVWRITRSDIFSTSVAVDAQKLSETISLALKQISQRDESAVASLKSLYNLLIEPIKAKLDQNLVVCFVPDKVLHYVPFDALISTDSGRYLVQDYRVLVSPSATILIDSTEKASSKASLKEERLLAVGNPAFDRTENPGLSNLPGAEREVDGIASRYPLHRVLVRGEATRKTVTYELTRADVAHFAAHYEIDPRSRLSSKLLLSETASESSGLDSADIYRMNLARTRLVILSGCKTGIEQQFRGEGVVSFARSFLVAGVPVVVASLWPVDSDATSELMIAFHRFRKAEHRSTTEALMLAQQEMMTSERYRNPFYWAGFTVIGGYSEF
jgi:CHAT domain-containing protein